jgi:hypothetical protein
VRKGKINFIKLDVKFKTVLNEHSTKSSREFKKLLEPTKFIPKYMPFKETFGDSSVAFFV